MHSMIQKTFAVLLTIAGIAVPTQSASHEPVKEQAIPTPILTQTIPAALKTFSLSSKKAAKDLNSSNISMNLATKGSEHSLPTYTTWLSPTASVVNIRTQPSTDTPVLKEAHAGESYPVISQKGSWYEVAVSPHQTGWIAGWVANTQSFHAADSLGTILNKDNVPLFAGPGNEFKMIRRLSKNTIVQPLFVSGDYVKVLDQQEQSGWIPIDSANFGKETVDSLWFADAATPVQASPDGLLAGKTIVIDPGHGGKDTGAIGKIQPIDEKDINLAVAKVLQQKLLAAGAHVIMTRTTDVFVSLADRVKISNENHADAFISIHQNMYPDNPQMHGTMTYYYESQQSHILAHDIEEQALKQFSFDKSNDTANLRTGVNNDELYVLHHNTQPATLVEGLFLSNPKELADSVTTDYQEKMADSIYKGVVQFLLK
ncbi:N-acetylmuramoyl-L-alanine amidase [Fodinisporobacter ferrooxydans]|uniref:N-acetylmuramoyl-L-alanine amidase n=1 Tax=Fodinisporobacter ferrooxydans TaxID=2901836 RepID=A0ABY4CR08_9BACL|nr:N-acetylmuramoyl-L-alanine amidase [Alicyclobacillaceae bacterium MYW30-H2]